MNSLYSYGNGRVPTVLLTGTQCYAKMAKFIGD